MTVLMVVHSLYFGIVAYASRELLEPAHDKSVPFLHQGTGYVPLLCAPRLASSVLWCSVTLP